MSYLTPAGLQALQGYESGGNPYAKNPSSSASGLYGFLNSTWLSSASAAGVDTTLYPTANSAPPSVQTLVASQTPVSNWTCPNCDPGFTAALSSNPQWLSSSPGTSNANPLDQAPSLSIDGSSPGTISAQGAYSGLSSGAPGLASGAAAGATLNQQLQNDTNAQNQTAGNTSQSWLGSLGDWFQRGGIMLFAVLAALAALLWLGMETKAGKQAVAAVSKVAA